MPRKLQWCGSCQKELDALPEGARTAFLQKLAFLEAGIEVGGLDRWHGIGDGKEMKFAGYRMVVCLEFDDSVYVLHAFKKGGGGGKKTGKKFKVTIDSRYRAVCAQRAAASRKQ